MFKQETYSNKVYAVLEEIWNADATKKIGVNIHVVCSSYAKAKNVVKMNQDNVHTELIVREFAVQ